MRRRRLLLADSSSLIALDRMERFSDVRGRPILITRAAKTEVVDDAIAVDPESPAYAELVASASRFRYRIETGDIRILDLDYTRYGQVVDRARNRLAKLERCREDETPKADAEIAGAIAQLFGERRTFDVLCDDKTLVEEVLRRMFPKVTFLRSNDLRECG